MPDLLPHPPHPPHPPSAPPADDADLLDRYARGGDRAAMDALVRRYVDFVYATARRNLGGDAHAADDVTQAVFLTLTRKARSVPPRRLGGWLFNTTRYTAANARVLAARRNKHERLAARQRPETSAMPLQPLSPTEPDALLPILDDALAALKPTDREALILRYLRGHPGPAVATALGLTEPAARKRIERALERLRTTLEVKAKATLPAAAVSASGVAGLLALATPPAAPAATLAGALAATSGAAGPSVITLAGQAARSMVWWWKAAAVAAALTASTAAVWVLGHRASPLRGPVGAALTTATSTVLRSDERSVPGRTRLVNFTVLLDKADADGLHRVTTPIDGAPGFFSYRRGAAQDVLKALEAPITEERVPGWFTRPQHFDPDSKRQTIEAMAVQNFMCVIERAPKRFEANLDWSPATYASLTPAADDIQIILTDPAVKTSLLARGTWPQEEQIGTASIDLSATLAPGEAVVVLGDFGPVAGEHFVTCSVWQAYRATDAQWGYLTDAGTSGVWVRSGPETLRRLADRAGDWTGGRTMKPAETQERWTRRLNNGAVVRLVALARPKRWPFCWWDADGKPARPVGGDALMNELPGGITTPRAARVHIQRPADPGQTRFEPRTIDFPLPEPDRKIEVWVANGTYNERAIRVGERVALGDGHVVFERVVNRGGQGWTQAILRGDLGPGTEVWIDAVMPDGTRVRTLGTRTTVIVTSETPRWRESSDNYSLKGATPDHYVLRWRPRERALFEGFADGPVPEPPVLEEVPGGGGEAVDPAKFR